ncbi:hypothetical protein MMC09_000367 [Bachmanniomyces sp. S44760]|nr:hypothetical protein [Bachmanniomyces sp. S44760]
MSTNEQNSTPTLTGKPHIVFVHGLWMTSKCWQEWIPRFEKKGYQTHAPAWPGLEGRSVEDIRRDPSALEGLGMKTICDHYEKFIKGLEVPPIIMGHSFGGLFVQILLSRGLGCAGCAIDPAMPSEVLALPLSQLEVAFPVFKNPFNMNGAVSLTKKQFHFAFCNELSEADSDKVYDEFAIPGDAKVLWQGALGAVQGKHSEAAVHFDKADRAPLLLTGGGKDHTVPPAVPKATMKHYVGPAVVEYKEFEGRTHYIVGQEGWEEVADYCLEFAEKHMAKS